MSLNTEAELALLQGAFPWHFFLDKEMRVRRPSPLLSSHCPGFVDGTACEDLLKIERPKVSFDFEQWSRSPRTTFTFCSKPEGILFRSQILSVPEKNMLMISCRPWSTNITELQSWGISMEDMGIHDPTWEFLMLMEQRDQVHAENLRYKDHLEDVVAQRTHELESLLGLASVLTENLDPKVFHSELATKLCEIMGVGDCCVYTSNGRKLSLRGYSGGITDGTSPRHISWGDGLAGRTAQEKKTQIEMPKKICAPVLVEDRLMGVVAIQPARGHDLNLTDEEALERYLRIVAPAFEASQHREELEQDLGKAVDQRRRLLEVAEETDPLGFSPGAHLGDFRLVRPIGRGGLGNVWEAVQLSLNRKVALKILGSVQSVDLETRDRFMKESNLASEMEHPCFLDIYTAGESDGTMFLSMELVKDWRTINDYLNVFRAIPILPDYFFKMLVDAISKVLDALSKAHQMGIVHGNLSPKHILMDDDVRPKLTGFGLAALESGQLKSKDYLSEENLRYHSPERYTNPANPPRPEDDLFSVGAMLHEALTYSVPPHAFRSEAPEQLVRIAQRAIHENHSERYHSTKAMAEDLARLGTVKDAVFRPPFSLLSLFKKLWRGR